MQEWVYPMQEWVYPKRLQPRKEPMLEARETWRKEAQRCYELITVLIPHPVLLFSVWKEGHRGARKEGVKLSLGRRGQKGSVFIYGLYFSPSNSNGQ